MLVTAVPPLQELQEEHTDRESAGQSDRQTSDSSSHHRVQLLVKTVTTARLYQKTRDTLRQGSIHTSDCVDGYDYWQV